MNYLLKLQGAEKAVAVFLITLSTWGATATTDGHISATDWFLLAGALGATFGAWAVPNTPPSD